MCPPGGPPGSNIPHFLLFFLGNVETFRQVLKYEPKGSRASTTLDRPNYGSLAKFSPTLPFMASSHLSFSWALSWVNTTLDFA